MHDTQISRREFGGLVAGTAAASTLASVGAFAAGRQSVRLIWWGNPDRDRRTNEVIDLYTKKTGTEVVPETYAWNDYWQKLATQAAGRNLPDLIQMDYRYIFEYARRQQLAALDDFVGNQLDARRLRPEPARLRQGRRQALRHLDGRQLDELRLPEADPRRARHRRCPIRPPGRTTTSSRSARR